MGVECKAKIFTEVNHSTNIPSKSPGDCLSLENIWVAVHAQKT